VHGPPSARVSEPFYFGTRQTSKYFKTTTTYPIMAEEDDLDSHLTEPSWLFESEPELHRTTIARHAKGETLPRDQY
jgi:hypothetical protein